MPFYFFNWTPEIEEHVADGGITPEQFESVVMRPDDVYQSRSSHRTVAFGRIDGELVCCVYEQVDDMWIDPVTAFFVEE